MLFSACFMHRLFLLQDFTFLCNDGNLNIFFVLFHSCASKLSGVLHHLRAAVQRCYLSPVTLPVTKLSWRVVCGVLVKQTLHSAVYTLLYHYTVLTVTASFATSFPFHRPLAAYISALCYHLLVQLSCRVCNLITSAGTLLLHLLSRYASAIT